MTENTGVGSLSCLQWIFLTQELNQGLLHCRRILYYLSYQPSRARDKWIGNFNTLCYILFFLVCIIFYDIREGALTWTREGDIKIKVAFILYFLALSFFLFYFWSHHMELVGSYFPEQPGIESKLPAVKVLSPNHWTSREFPRLHFKVLIAKKKRERE